MSNARDQKGNLLSDAQGLTRFGRFLRSSSLDELPELWNVIKGDMSLVGPRPLPMQYLDRYTSEQARRHEVMPGVTIEDEVQIGSHCAIYSVSTIDDKKGQVTLKKNCRIGSHNTIMPGVITGENAIIGAHSFVNRDVPANTTAVGVPVRVIKT
jgi:acyl-[acyl carrier protein]--UDP-N-acetylglucosamine O-acyltransferase